MRIKSVIVCAWIVLFPAVCSADPHKADAANAPFRPGERLHYELFWEFIPAGTAVIEVLPIATLQSTKAYHFAITIKSNAFVDKFYKVRDRVESYTDLKVSHSILYKKKTQEGKHKGDITVTFDWEKSLAEFSNFGKKHKPVSLPPGTFDPLSVFYAFRLRELSENMTVEAPVTDGKKLKMGTARVLTSQKVKVQSGEYDTILVEPDMKDVGGVFHKSKNAKLLVWITSDPSHIPVKITSSVVVGRFVAELVSVERK